MDPLPFLLVSFVSMITGAAAGGLFVYALYQGKKPHPPDAGSPPYEGVLLRRDPASGEHRLEIDGKPLASRAELTSFEETELKTALAKLSGWAGGEQAHGREQEPGARAAAPVPQAPERPASVYMPPLKRHGLIESVTRAVQADVKKPVRQKTIAQQVDDILQEMLKDSPLHQRGVRIADAPKGGLAVWVGLDQYDGVNEVPDEEVRRLITAAVDRWRKQTE